MLNIENHHKYSLTALQLYAVTNVKTLRGEKSEAIFDSLIENLNKLNSKGLVLSINLKVYRYYGILAFCLGDTPALNWLGGFKESVSKANKYCRICEIKKGENKYNSVIAPRNINIHMRRLNQMKRVSFEQSQKLSKKYGINYSSPMLKIDDFNICKSLLQDPMHILYEGICHLELKCLLNELINVSKIFDLNFLNAKIKTFSYFDIDKTDKPNIIESISKDISKFSQSSGQMSTLFQNLPLFIGEKLKGNKFWKNFLRLLSIISLTFSICYDDRTIEEIDKEIKSYLENFSKLYSDVSMTPKMHFLVHFAQQMKDFGPLGFHSTARLEAKNGLIKKFDNTNFKNICKSISYRQEFWMVSKRLGADWDKKNNFLSKGIETKNFRTGQIHDQGFTSKYYFDTSLSCNTLQECDNIKILGFLYELNAFIIIRDNLDVKEKTVAKIIRIMLANDNLVFKLDLYDIEFVEHINCYKIASSNEVSYRYFKNIVHKKPINGLNINSDYFIQVRNFFHKLR